MLQTELGKKVEGWSASGREELKNDLEKLVKVPIEALRSVVDKIAKTHPACNTLELAAFEAEQRGISNPEQLTDSVSVWTYIWENIDGESPQAFAADSHRTRPCFGVRGPRTNRVDDGS